MTDVSRYGLDSTGFGYKIQLRVLINTAVNHKFHKTQGIDLLDE